MQRTLILLLVALAIPATAFAAERKVHAFGTADAITSGSATDHWVILDDITNSSRESAAVDISTDGSGTAEFVVIPSGEGPTAPATAPLNVDGYASSSSSSIPNLFTPSDGNLAMVRATYGAGLSSAVLRQRSGTTKILLGIPAASQSLGIRFNIPTGDLAAGYSLLIGNPGGTAAGVRLGLGNGGTPVSSFAVASFDCVKVDIANANANLVLISDQPVFVQIAVDTGKVDETFILPMG